MKKKKIALSRKLVLQKEKITGLYRITGGDGPGGSAGCDSIFICNPGNNSAGVCYSEDMPSFRICPVKPVTVSCGPAYCANPDTYVSCAAGPGCAVPATNGAGPCQASN